ncbi:serine hydrolase [Lapillicoccus sp.]|uniref:serine hydrolase n=1 Tax=Lapillicoccus sp. TaxID=1909287 RepID=UPI003265F70D
MPPAHPHLAARLTEVVRRAPGQMGVAVVADEGWSWSSDADRVGPSASTVKVLILVATLRAVELGTVALDEPVPLPGKRVGGAGPLSLLPSVTSLPLVEMLRLMIALSDNDATNAVIDHVGLLTSSALPTLLASVPTRHTALRRRLMDFAAAERGLQNETSAADLVAVMVALRRGRLLGGAMTAAAFEVLRAQQDRAGLPGYLAEDVLVASKTGEIVGVRADVAVLERGARWVAVAALADDLVDEAGVDRGSSVIPVFAAIGELAAELL